MSDATMCDLPLELAWGQMAPPRKLISVYEAATELLVSEARVRELLAAGRIKGAQKIGRALVIPSPVKVTPGRRSPKPRREQG